MLLTSVVAAVLAAPVQGRGLLIVRDAGAAVPAPEQATAPPSFGESEPVPPPVPERHVPKAAYVVMGLAGAAAATGIAFGVQALHEKRDFDDGDKSIQRAEAIERKAVLADMAFGAALTFAVTGAVLWWTAYDRGSPLTAQLLPSMGQRADQRRPSVLLAPLVSANGNGAVALLRF